MGKLITMYHMNAIHRNLRIRSQLDTNEHSCKFEETSGLARILLVFQLHLLVRVPHNPTILTNIGAT